MNKQLQQQIFFC